MDDKHYFLFGKEAVSALIEGQTIEQVIKHDCTIFCYDDRHDYPEDILSAFVGWGDYAVISEEEYEQFKQHIQ